MDSLEPWKVRLLRAIERFGPPSAQARAVGLTHRRILHWHHGDIPEIIGKLEAAGVIEIKTSKTEETARAA